MGWAERSDRERLDAARWRLAQRSRTRRLPRQAVGVNCRSPALRGHSWCGRRAPAQPLDFADRADLYWKRRRVRPSRAQQHGPRCSPLPYQTNGGPNMSASPTVHRWRAFALLAVAYFMTIVDLTIVNVSLPTIGHDLHFTQTNLQWVATAYALTFGGLLLLGGRAADLLGRRRVL